MIGIKPPWAIVLCLVEVAFQKDNLRERESPLPIKAMDMPIKRAKYCKQHVRNTLQVVGLPLFVAGKTRNNSSLLLKTCQVLMVEKSNPISMYQLIASMLIQINTHFFAGYVQRFAA